jgi:hypothetical protein
MYSDVVGGYEEDQDIVWSVNGTGSYMEPDAFRGEGINFINENVLSVYEM